MEFRFKPRQGGLYAGNAAGGTKGGGDTYDPKNLVTDAEISRMKKSSVKPYIHRKNVFDPLPKEKVGDHDKLEREIGAYSKEKAKLDASLRRDTEFLKMSVDMASPTEYTGEADMTHSGALASSSTPAKASGLGCDADGNVIFK